MNELAIERTNLARSQTYRGLLGGLSRTVSPLSRLSPAISAVRRNGLSCGCRWRCPTIQRYQAGLPICKFHRFQALRLIFCAHGSDKILTLGPLTGDQMGRGSNEPKMREMIRKSNLIFSTLIIKFSHIYRPQWTFHACFPKSACDLCELLS